MMRKFSTCLMICATWLFVSSCKDEVSSPPKSNLAVDKTSGLANETVFTFTVDNAPGAGTISLLPYGTANLSLGGIPTTSFTDGKAQVKFTYAQVGTFNAVVATNNHSADGKSVKNVYSAPITITITSEKNQITDFSFAKITTTVNYKEVVVQPLISLPSNTVIDQVAHTIKIQVPYKTDLTALIPTFSADPFSKVTIAGTEQKSASTPNNYTSPVAYTVTSNNGSVNTYTVTVTPLASNNDFTFKSLTGKETSKAVNGKVLNSALATSGTDLVFYDTLGSPSTNFDSVQINYELNNEFAALHLNPNKNKLKQGTQIDLSTSKQFTLNAQDSASVNHVFNVHAVAAPKLVLSSPVINTTSVNTNFNILVKALKGTVTNSKLNLDFIIPPTPPGVTVTSITLYDKSNPGGTTVVGNATVDFNDAVTIVLHVTDTILGLMYDVKYTAGLTELK